MIDELKPCPFCGERLEEVEQGSEYFRHSNNGCFFSWHEFDMGGHSSMAKNWNRRAQPEEFQLDPITFHKMSELITKGYVQVGVIMGKEGERAYVDMGKVTWGDKP